MTQKEVFSLAQKDSSGSPRDRSIPGDIGTGEDLDAFLADLKRTLSEDPADAPRPKSDPNPSEAISRKSAPIAAPPREDRSRRRKDRSGQEPRDSGRNGGARNPEPSGGFLIRHHRAVNAFLILLCLALAAGIAAVILFQDNTDPLDGKIMENVQIAGVDVGGMSKDEAYNAVNDTVGSSFSDGVMVVELGSSQLILSSSQTRPSLQIRNAVEAAFAYGRTGSASQRQQEYRDAQYAPKEVPLEQFFSVDTDYIRSTVSDFLSGIAGEYSPSGYTLEGERPALDAAGYDSAAPCQTLVLTMGTPGSGFDLDGICGAIVEGYCQGNFHVVVPQTYLPQFPEKLDIDEIYRQLHVDAVEAVVTPGTGEVIPGSCGYTFPLEEARAQLSAASYGQVISIPMEYVVPAVLDSNGSYTESLSSFRTPVSSNEAYNQNMKLMCKMLDGLVLEPGDSFSFNTFFKNRTEQNGYQNAPRHGDSCVDEEVGGGADQIATTLYVAAMTADLSITEKHPAGHLCTYTTKGTELTVGASWQDLKLKNTLKIPVLIRARVTDQQVTVQVLSETPLDYYVKLETKEGYTIAHGTQYVSRKSADGYTNGQVLVEGVDGCQVNLIRIKYDRETDRELSRTTEYAESRPVNTIIVNVTG